MKEFIQSDEVRKAIFGFILVTILFLAGSILSYIELIW